MSEFLSCIFVGLALFLYVNLILPNPNITMREACSRTVTETPDRDDEHLSLRHRTITMRETS